MPNRIIKESICRSDSIDSLSWFEEVMFYRLIVVCDDYGRFDGRAAIIKGSCFPLKDVTVKQIDKSLNKLVSVGLVRRYEAGGRPYLQMSTWEKHQQIRAKRSKFPAPDETCNHLISNDIKCARNPIRIQSESNPNPNPNARTRGEVSQFEGEVSRIGEFISAYPKDCNRHLTEREYISLLSTGKITESELVKCALNYAEACKILGTQGRYIKKAENFLKDFTFEEYLPGKYKKPETGKKNQFNNFDQRDYSQKEMRDLEKMFLQKNSESG